jgi:putative nucleotidyltransferase with HDIG domain
VPNRRPRLAMDTESNVHSQIMKTVYDEVLLAFGQAIDLRDNETAGHSMRVTRYSTEISTAMGCPPQDLERFARGAYLHDIGKIAIPDAILHKPGKLTQEETEVMRSHAWIGYNIVSRVSFLVPCAEIVLSHHERFEGGGYPQDLSGEQIPLGARIFAVADTLDAITVDRPYRKAAPFSVARDEIIRESGKQFDPVVVQAFRSIPEREILDIMSVEIRRYARVPLHTSAHCRVGQKEYKANTVNIGEGGMLLENANGLTVGQEFEIDFRLDEMSGPVNAKARIIRKELPSLAGAKFVDLTTVAQTAIRSYIASQVQF